MNTAITSSLTATDRISGRDIVIVGIQPWYYELGSNCKNIARQLSKDNRVLYVNIPVSRKSFYSKNKIAGLQRHCDIIKGKGEPIQEIKENMWEFYPTTLIEPINSLPSTALFRIINRINNRKFAKDLRWAIEKMGFKDIILFNDNDIYTGYHLKELLSPSVYVYYMRDFLQGNDYWKKHTAALEPELIKKSDVVVANSTYYAEYCLQFNPRSYYIGQGCNIELFDNDLVHPPAEGAENIAAPIIGYVGAVDSGRLDIPTIETIAAADPSWNIVLVGPEDEAFRTSRLHQMPNVHFIGRKEMRQLPAYVKLFDVCMNPQWVNLITMGNYPLKIDEYLAMGKAIVATRTKAMEIFEDYTYLADMPAEYPDLIRKAMTENSETKSRDRIAYAHTHTWENSVDDLYKAILAFENK